MFAYWHRAETRVGRQIPVNMWLLFRDVAPSIANMTELDLKTLQTSFRKFLLHDSDAVSWSEIEDSITQLSVTGWEQHEGYRELCAIVSHLKTDSSSNDIPRHLHEWLPQTRKRVERGQAWHFSVDPLTETCVAKDCSGRNVTDPKKRKDFKRLAPTICSTCGAVLVPDRLWTVYEAIHE